MKPLKAIARRALDAAKVFASLSAREILRREPVITGGLLVSVGLAVAAWFGFAPSSESQQVWQTVAAALAPTVTALLASMAAWSPAGHAANVADAAAAYLAGWNPADGKAPDSHTLPPPVDPEIGSNGIGPTGAEQIA